MWRGRGAGPGYLRGEAGLPRRTARSHGRQQCYWLTEDQSGYVASILSRRTGLPEPMWDLDNAPLLGRLSQPQQSGLRRMGLDESKVANGSNQGHDRTCWRVPVAVPHLVVPAGGPDGRDSALCLLVAVGARIRPARLLTILLSISRIVPVRGREDAAPTQAGRAAGTTSAVAAPRPSAGVAG
jgi:hypothetical protein